MLRLPLPRLRDGMIPAEDASALLRWVQYWRPMEISTDDARGFRHPWQLSLRWFPRARRWQGQLHRESYVAGPAAREVLAPAAVWDDLGPATRRRLGGRDPGEPVRPWLSEEPWLPLPETVWRPLGKDAPPTESGGETIPQPLIDLGAGTGDELRVDRENLTLTVSSGGSIADRARARLVRAVDLVLNVSRERVRLEAGNDGVIGVTLDPASDADPWLTVERARFEEQAEPEGVLEQFAAALDDGGVDRRLAARAYLLSPPGLPPGSPIDGTWSPYVQQGLFWNPQHRTNREINVVEPLRLTFPTGLALGAGDDLIGVALADLNTRDALASLLASRARVVGQFFT